MTHSQDSLFALVHQQTGPLSADGLQVNERFKEALKGAYLNVKDYLALGQMLFEQGQVQDAIVLLEHALTHLNESPQLHTGLGQLLCANGQKTKAGLCFRAALQLDPIDAESGYNLAVLLHEEGYLEEAIASYRMVFKAHPHRFDVLSNLGIALLEAGQLDAAGQAFLKAVQQAPDYANAYNGLGNVYQKMEKWEEALSCYEKAVQLGPKECIYRYNQALTYQKLGQRERAIEDYQHSIDLDPNFANSYRNLGGLYLEAQDFDRAIQCFERALLLNPEDAESCNNWGNLLSDRGNLVGARQYYAKALATQPANFLWWLRAESLSPVIAKDNGEILAYRQQMEKVLAEARQRLEKLVPEQMDLEQLALSGCEPSFFLRYQGQDDLPLKSAYGDLFYALFNHLYPHLMQPPKPHNSPLPRIGILVTEGHEWIFNQFMMGFLQHLSRELFQITVIGPPQAIVDWSSRIQTLGLNYLPLSHSFLKNIEQIKAEQFDLIFFYEIGTDAVNYFLPFFRLAQVQCTSWGDPVTTGIPTVDYFISSVLLETATADSHYRETLVRFKEMPTCFTKPIRPETCKSREYFGLREDQHVYFCPHKLFKVHPDFDLLMAEILDRDPDAYILFIKSQHAEWDQMLINRWQEAFPHNINRILFLPQQTNGDFAHLLLNSDVILETLHFGGGQTSLETLGLGKPIVTMPAPYMRGRVTAGLYEKMGIYDCICPTLEAYVEQAIRLGTDSQYQQALQQKLLAANHVLYDNREAVQELESFILNAIEKSRAQKPTELNHHSAII